MKRRKTQSSPASPRRARLRLEQLEDRNLMSVNVLESFESAVLNNYRSLFHYLPAADVHPAAAHNGSPGLGLIKNDGYDWVTRGSQASPLVARGQTVSVWTQFAGAVDGRINFGFGTQPQATTSSTSSFRTLAVTLAGNTNQIFLERWTGNSNPTNLGSASYDFEADHWYRVEVEWGATGSLTAQLYDSDGVTPLLPSPVTGTDTVITQGGIGFRGFGSPKYFDTVVLDDDSTGNLADRAFAGGDLPADWQPGTPPPARANLPAEGNSAVPWQYRDAVLSPIGNRDIELISWGQVAQVARVGDFVAISGQNNSRNNGGGGGQGVDWGPEFGGPATPLLVQFLFRQLPGEATQLIGTPGGAKHFFAPSILTPGQTDIYGSGLNASQSLITPGLEIDPTTGVLHRPTYLRSTNIHGINSVTVPHSFTPLDNRLVVPIADLDPNQNPVGTRWWLMAIAYVEGDTNTANNSRYVEVRPNWNPATLAFTFTYPPISEGGTGSSGQQNFRTIPGLVEPEQPVRVIDNDQPGFSLQGNWQYWVQSGYGYNDTSYWIDNGTADDTATWAFTGLRPGQYRISVTYPPDAYYGTAQYYTISSGGNVLATAVVNATSDTFDFVADGAAWKNLGSGLFTVSGYNLVITLSGLGTGSVVADAVRIERIGPEPLSNAQSFDDSDPSVFAATTGFSSAGGQGFLNSLVFADPSEGSEAAWWFIGGLEPGVYQISVTYTADSDRATDAPFYVSDGLDTFLGAVPVDQQQEPGDFFDQGVGWRILGEFEITSGSLFLLLSSSPTGVVIADAIHIVRVA